MKPVSEDDVITIWAQICRTPDMVTNDGTVLTVLHPGCRHGSDGPDFRDAVLLTPGGIVRGDIEIHVHTGGWRQHHHDNDPAYNRVVLHVVARGGPAATRRQNGGNVPVLVMELLARPETVHQNRIPGPSSPPEEILAELDAAGTARFRSKAENFLAEIASIGPAECLYRGIMEALGYSKNKPGFRELAIRVPLGLLEGSELKGLDDKSYEAIVAGVLRQVAGFATDRSRNLDGTNFNIRMMETADWELHGVRPGNRPVIRIAAFSHLLRRYRSAGLFNSLLGLIKNAPATIADRFLESGLIAEADGVTLLGRGRAGEVIVNILLPFAEAWGGIANDAGLREKALSLFNNYPGRLFNSVEARTAWQLGLDVRRPYSARRLQGLIHIYRTRCAQGACQLCQLCSRRPATTSRLKPSIIPA